MPSIGIRIYDISPQVNLHSLQTRLNGARVIYIFDFHDARCYEYFRGNIEQFLYESESRIGVIIDGLGDA